MASHQGGLREEVDFHGKGNKTVDKNKNKLVMEHGTDSLSSDTGLPITKQHFVLILYSRDGLREKERQTTK